MPRQSILVPCAALDARCVDAAPGSAMDVYERHPAHELYCQLDGLACCLAGECRYTLCAGSLLLLPAGLPHRFTVPGKAPARGIEVHFTQEALRPLAEAFPQSDLLGAAQGGEGICAVLPPAVQPSVETALRRVAALADTRRADDRAQCCLLLGAVLLAARPLWLAAAQPGGTAARQLAQAAQAYIAQGYSRPLTLPALAQRLKVSPAYLSRTFRQAVGVGFSAYLNVVRVREAQARLQAGEQDLNAVAQQCGFSNGAHFRRAFKQVCGVTPARYRKRCKTERPSAEAEG